MKWWTEGDQRGWGASDNQMSSSALHRHTCLDHGICILTSAKGQWCCQGSQSRNGPNSHHIFILMNDFSIL